MNQSTLGAVAIVTGAADGLGYAIAHRLFVDGYRVIASDISDRVHLAFGSPDERDMVRTVVADAGDARSGDVLISTALETFGRVDAIINNAGVGGPGSLLEDTAVDDVIDVFNVNLLGSIRLCQAAIPHLKAQRSGRIVNLGSVYGEQPVIQGSAYCMSKAAIRSLSQCLALELGPFGITVNTVAPGYMLTAMHRDEIALQAGTLGISVDERMRQLRASVPLQRQGTGDDVAGTVAWLLSADTSYVTGQTIGVNGGIRAS